MLLLIGPPSKLGVTASQQLRPGADVASIYREGCNKFEFSNIQPWSKRDGPRMQYVPSKYLKSLLDETNTIPYNNPPFSGCTWAVLFTHGLVFK